MGDQMSEYGMHVDPRRLKFVRLASTILSELQEAYSREKDARGITKAELADLLGVHKSAVSRRLNGTSNLTLESIANLAWGLDHEIAFRLIPTRELVGKQSNYDWSDLGASSSSGRRIIMSEEAQTSSARAHG